MVSERFAGTERRLVARRNSRLQLADGAAERRGERVDVERCALRGEVLDDDLREQREDVHCTQVAALLVEERADLFGGVEQNVMEVVITLRMLHIAHH